MAKTGLKLTTTLDREEATLLSTLYREFKEDVLNHPLNDKGQLVSAPPTRSWLLHALKLNFKGILGVACKHKLYGTLLYRNGGDLIRALSKSLGLEQEAAKKHVDTHRELNMATKMANETIPMGGKEIVKACHALKTKLQKQAKIFIATYNKIPISCATFGPVSVLQEVDPLVSKCLDILTTPAQSRARKVNAT